MRKNRVVEQNRCYHLVSRLAHRAFFLDDEEKGRAVALTLLLLSLSDADKAAIDARLKYAIGDISKQGR